MAASAQAIGSTSATKKSAFQQPKKLPVPNSDFYQLVEVLTEEEKAIVKKVRNYMETEVQPIINKYWSDDAFPFELLPSFKELQLGGLGYEGYGCAGGSQKLFGFVAMELARSSTRRSARSSACTAAWRWARSILTARRSRNRSGCRPWRAGRRSVASA